MYKYGREGKKGKFCARGSQKGGERQGAGGRDLPPVNPLIFENIGDDSYGFK